VRTLRSGHPETQLSTDDQPVVNFASNDYLGLSQHPTVIAAAQQAAANYGTGAGAARLVVGGRPIHDELEAELAASHGTEAALLFTTGYQANVGVLGALGAAAPGLCIVSDRLNHASIIDGARLTGAEIKVYDHADQAHAAELVRAATQAAGAADRGVVVVSDAVFSMDGDLAPVEGLRRLCAESGALLVLDVAHDVFHRVARSSRGATPCDEVIVGTLSKALGSVGGYVAGTAELVSLCVNHARSFIFTTATAPPDAAAALAALRIDRSAAGAELRDRLAANVALLLPGHDSPIVPVVLGAESLAAEVSAQLLARGLLVPAIRPPTVAPGASRLRIALSAVHTHEQVARLRTALDELVPYWLSTVVG
jgi:8-amino-7-oxononanoate synthase